MCNKSANVGLLSEEILSYGVVDAAKLYEDTASRGNIARAKIYR